MNHWLGRSSHLRLYAPRLYAPAKSNFAYPYAGAKPNLAYFYLGAMSNPCPHYKTRGIHCEHHVNRYC